jgi:hypothetical protein
VVAATVSVKPVPSGTDRGVAGWVVMVGAAQTRLLIKTNTSSALIRLPNFPIADFSAPESPTVANEFISWKSDLSG